MTKSNVSRSSRAKSGGKASLEPCACCGIARDPQGRPFSITFEQPDVIFDIEEELLETWGEDPFLVIKTVGFYVRVILPVKLTDGFSVDFGTWLEVQDEDFRTAWKAWNAPEYKDLTMEGCVANAIAPWGEMPFKLVRAVVRDTEKVPYLVSSDEESISKILTRTWPHAEVLKPYAELLRSDPPAES